MPRRALRLTRGVLDLTHLVEMDERVEQGQIDTGEGPPDRESFAFVALGCGGRRTYGAFDGFDEASLATQGRGRTVARGHGWHGFFLGQGGSQR